jgi:hypothetical protein
MTTIKKRCITNAENKGIIGSKLTLKTTFLTRKLLARILLVPEDNASEKKNHGKIPVTNHKINGKLSTGCDLNPTWNTNQKIATVAVG